MTVRKDPLGFEKLVVSNASIGLASIPLEASWALIVCETQPLRWRDDGTPTATDGIPMIAGQSMEYDADLKNLRFIRSAAADATIQVAYYQGT